MADERDFEDDAGGRQYTKPHSGQHPIPTIQGYREHRKELQGQVEKTEEAQEGPEDGSKPNRAFHSVKAILKGDDDPSSQYNPYPSANHNYANPDQHKDEPLRQQESRVAQQHDPRPDDEKDNVPKSGNDEKHKKDGDGKQAKSATEAAAGTVDPRQKRKAMKKNKRHDGGREVTDPVTHMPIVIYDKTDKDLNSAPENEPEVGTKHENATGPQGASKSEEELEAERRDSQRSHNGMQKVFPPPDFEYMRKELANVYQQALYTGLGVIGVVAAVPFVVASWSGRLYPQFSMFFGLTCIVASGFGVAAGLGQWMRKKANEVFDDEVWDAARREEFAAVDSDAELPESVQWLNSLFAAIWPLVNPDLFSSFIDTIEDVMQASLPKFVKMVSVDDMGQGNESLRILGVRWLPTGAAGQTVGADGQLQDPGKATESDRTDPENGQEQSSNNGGKDDNAGDDASKHDGQDQSAIREGMEAEEGDFVNMELAFSYRSRSSGKSMKEKAKNAHLYLKFYLPGGIAVPVWVELRGIIGIMRMRLQLTPDPPFFSLCTLTFLGQPKANLSCVPLSKHSLNLMDVPLISSFVQSAIDASLAEFVAPKSLTLNLKDMLVGEDFKKDTMSKGVVWILIKRARGFTQGDGNIVSSQGTSDSYVTVSWGKFGKPVASTRIIEDDQEPDWHEWASILVSPEELNAEEKLRLQLWDSDKWTADDDLGRVELDLKDLMNNPESHNKIQEREDRFHGQDPDENMPGTLTWSVGYFSKTRITQQQLDQQTVNEEIRSKDALKKHVSEAAEHKLREAGKAADDDELHQQKAQDFKELEDSMIISAPPSNEFTSGILSVQIHNITGLEVHNLQKQDKGKNDADEDSEEQAEQTDDMPDSYCTIILNHRKIYRSRTKPKNSKPFFNASTERFIKDWKTTEVIISVRDAREREEDPLIGIVYLPLEKVLAKKSQVMNNFPLVGGIGYGRARISMVWRSVEAKLPPQLLGWDYGTIEIRGTIKAKDGLLDNMKQHRIKIRTNLGRAKMYADNGEWTKKDKEDDSVFLPLRKRYASPLIIEFRESSFGPDKTPAFAVLWLHELIDEREEVHSLKVWNGGKENLRKAESCYGYNGLKEGEQPLGEVEVPLKFWRGLSGYHKAYAAKVKNGDLRNVMECLDTISDESLGDEVDVIDSDSDSEQSDERSGDNKAKKKLKVHTNDSSSSSEDSNDDGKRGLNSVVSLSAFKKAKNVLRNPIDGGVDTATSVLAPGHNDSDDGSRGIRNSLRDYKDHHKQLHRKHRGIMQFRAAREVDHLGSKFSRMKGNVSGFFHHNDKDAGIETEV